jgi:hypothetical protein
MNFDWNRFPINSGYVIAPGSAQRLVGGPKTTNAIKIPKKMFIKQATKVPF